MSSSAYELLYFDAPGRAEAVRICLHAAGIQLKDTRPEFAEWPQIKPTTPLGKFPVLKINDVQYCQSVALARYAGKMCGFYPTDSSENGPTDALIVDIAMDTLNEIMSLNPMGEDREKVLAERKEFQKTTLTKYADYLESLIQKNGSGETGFVSTPSIADILLKVEVEAMQGGYWTGDSEGIDKNFFDSYPGIMGTVASISKNDKVVSYYTSKE